MPLNIWTESSGYSFGTIAERSVVDLQLPVTYANTFNDSTNIDFSVISGSLPPGLRISSDKIIGTPFEVPRTTEFKFCVRASYGSQLADRTFKMTVSGADEPTWITNAGLLPVGPNDAYFILDNSFIDFQLEAIDYDTTTGQTLKYFISNNEGELPPGLILTESGRITGFIQPLLTVKVDDGDGSYDNGLYDSVAFDFGYRSSNGYDSYVYDSVFFDFSSPVTVPRKLNRNYEFLVSVTDGDTVSKRKFRIYVVGDDFFRADNIIIRSGEGTYTADVTFARAPIWITPNYLGIRRANNYQTFILETYENIPGLPPPVYSLDLVNPDSTPSVLPPGMTFDPTTSEVFGSVPYQPAITTTYKFTITATRYFTNNESASSKRTFTVDILGEVDSTITWNTDPDLGSIEANLISNLKVSATTTVTNAILIYTVVDGALPPGLSLNLNGEIVGKVNQFASGNVLGIITFDQNATTFDGNTTTIDKSYTFTVKVRDQYLFSATTRTFTVNVSTPNDRLYSTIYAKPLLKQSQRDIFSDFINDTNIFDPQYVYRLGDSNFGVQKNLQMLIFAGIETKAAAAYASAMGRNHKNKRFLFGDVKKAVAKNSGSNNIVYEVVYVELQDPLEKGIYHLDPSVVLSADPDPITIDERSLKYSRDLDILNLDTQYPLEARHDLSVDSQTFFAGESYQVTRFPSSISNWQYRIRSVGLTDRNYMPLWMRSIQPGEKRELGYITAVPLCFCLAGGADQIILNIKNSQFDFKQIDYTIDRYIIDSVSGSSGDKYLAFSNHRTAIV